MPSNQDKEAPKGMSPLLFGVAIAAGVIFGLYFLLR